MKQSALLIFCFFILTNCAKVENASNENAQTNANKIAAVSPTIKDDANKIVSVSPLVGNDKPLEPVEAKVKLNSNQKKYLNESLPLQVREVLEKAEKFQVLAEVYGENNNGDQGRQFEPNRIAVITDKKDKKEILESFYYDASAGPNPSACYIPHHGIRANYQGKTVEVEICFQCHLFSVNSSFGKFYGGLPYENVKSEELLNRLIQNQSVELKQ